MRCFVFVSTWILVGTFQSSFDIGGDTSPGPHANLRPCFHIKSFGPVQSILIPLAESCSPAGQNQRLCPPSFFGRYRRLWGSQWSYPRTEKKWIIAVNLGRNPKACSVCHGYWCLTRSKPFFWSMETKLFSFLNDPETSNMLQINMALISLPSPQ